jgi:hypothetical protein
VARPNLRSRNRPCGLMLYVEDEEVDDGEGKGANILLFQCIVTWIV